MTRQSIVLRKSVVFRQIEFAKSPGRGFLAALMLLAFHLPLANSEASDVRVRVVDYLPAGYVRDGSVSYEAEIQRAIDAVSETGGTVVFDPMRYRIENPNGLAIRSGLVLQMAGARFELSEDLAKDGQVFHGQNVTSVRFNGGEIVGKNADWPAGVNVRGIYLTGTCSNIRICDMRIRDLSSNGVGVFAESADQPATDVWIENTVIDNCSNVYGDYRAPQGERRGPEKGSTREDQGLIAFYNVHEFNVHGCRLEDSRSDGTHFYACRRGQISDTRIYRAKMGGYFLETCRNVLASNNIIKDNGSRGVTIERDCRFCTLTGNTIQGSGREGLWIPDSSSCVISGNVFTLNGRKPNGGTPETVWNSNVTINQARGDKFNSPTANYVLTGNLIETDNEQTASIRVDTEPDTEGIMIQGNLLIGPNRRILVEGPDQGAVTVAGNSGALVERLPNAEAGANLR